MSAIYAVCCEALKDEKKLNSVLPRLDILRRSKTKRLQSAQRRAQSAAAGLLAAYLLGGERLTYDDHGRPVIGDDTEKFISISHTDDWVFCVLSDSPIGIDAQRISPYRDSVVARLFSPAEQQTDKSDSVFTRIWTGKEALYKLRGVLPLDVLKTTNFAAEIDGFDPSAQCFRRHLMFDTGIHITACTASPDALPDEVIEIPLSTL